MADLTAALEGMRAKVGLLARALRPRRVEVALPPLEAAKLDYLAAGGRDFRALTPGALAAIGRAFAAGLVEAYRGAGAEAPWRRAGEAWREVVRARLDTGGGELRGRWAPLLPATVARKGSARIGYDTGDLAAAYAAAEVVVR